MKSALHKSYDEYMKVRNSNICLHCKKKIRFYHRRCGGVHHRCVLPYVARRNICENGKK